MAHEKNVEMPKLGFGCMGLTGVYSSPLADGEGIAIIKDAYNKGITFFDTADIYGANANEILAGKALKQLPREKIQLATKLGIVRLDASKAVVKDTPDHVRSCCDASLKCLDVDYINMYYQHRVDTSVPIEETIILQKGLGRTLVQMGELKRRVEEGKIKYIGVSEACPDTCGSSNHCCIEDEIIPLCRCSFGVRSTLLRCRELGIGIVPYSPLGRRFFGGKALCCVSQDTRSAFRPL